MLNRRSFNIDLAIETAVHRQDPPAGPLVRRKLESGFRSGQALRCLAELSGAAPCPASSKANRFILSLPIPMPKTLKQLLRGCTLVLVASVFLRTALSADWPQWGGDDSRNMAAQERNLPTEFHPGRKKRDRLGFDPKTAKNVKWCVRLGTENYSSPTIAGGRVYIGANDEALDDPRFRTTRGGVMLCLDEQTGKSIWQLPVPRL